MSRQVLEGLTKSIAIELATKQIRVNTVCPTFIETPTRRFGRVDGPIVRSGGSMGDKAREGVGP
ncbi:MAG: hypothetical protein CMM08_07180 [Rhodospirillaceae bacterium]|jgi:NAD(P)-dependent dehydrogenase (short-subunit alcohol dehydrogenase family)|nr:hypothetical protein [Rhodospirillaceae bacterium]|tara:strand:- start:1123 stop:1314 length:192 start_codon:yes stop_codon:yes gene_type:complete